MTHSLPHIAGVILAGGQSRRFGSEDKCLSQLQHIQLVERVKQKALSQVNTLLLSTNSDDQQYQHLDLPQVRDSVSGYPGPLAGVLAAMEHIATHQPKTQWLVSFAADSPFFPLDLVNKLMAASADKKIICANSGGWRQPTFSLWHMDLREALQAQLQQKKIFKVGAFINNHPFAEVDFPFERVDPFFNINTQDELQQAQQLMEQAHLR